jgi:hypothetical protein
MPEENQGTAQKKNRYYLEAEKNKSNTAQILQHQPQPNSETSFKKQ